MKKVLFASTALVAAGLMTASAASASEKIKLNLGGYSKWFVVGAWQDDKFETATFNNGAASGDTTNVDVKGDNEIFFGGSTTLDNGMKVGIQIELEAGGQADSTVAAGAATASDTIDESYIFVETGFGKFIVGSENNGTYLLHVNAPDAAGNWNEGSMPFNGQIISAPGGHVRLNTTAIDTDGDAEKITYVAPAFYGLTVGGSYIPSAGSAAGDNPTVEYGAVPAYGVGALYANTFGGVGVKASAGYVIYDIQGGAGQTKDEEMAFGAQLSYAGFTLGGAYRDRDRDDVTGANGNVNDANAWDVGLQYASGPYAVSIGYFRSEGESTLANTDQDTWELYQVSGKYTLGAGVDVLATVGHQEFDGEEAEAAVSDANHNKGWYVMTGLGLAF